MVLKKYRTRGFEMDGPLGALLARFLKFASVGVLTTLFGLSANFVLLKFFGTPLFLTYAGVYLSNILLSYFLNARYTFQVKRKWNHLLLYYLVYFSSMVLGLGILRLFKTMLPFEDWVFPFMVFPFTMLWNFFFVSKVLKKHNLTEKNHD